MLLLPSIGTLTKVRVSENMENNKEENLRQMIETLDDGLAESSDAFVKNAIIY